MRDEIINMKKEVQAVKNEEQTLATELIKETKSQKKMWFIAWLITFLILIGVSCYTIWLYHDIGVVEETIQEIEDIGSIDNSNIINGGK